MPFLVEESEKEQKAYKSLLIKDPKLFTSLSSDLALKIIEILSKQPFCAMDIARKLKQHEQKIYYHLRNLEKLGVIKLLKTEERVGATAKIYTVDFPVVSFKLFDGEGIINSKIKIRELNFLKDFIEDGKLNATIIIGSPDPHGKYGAQSTDGSCAIDLSLFLGTLVKDPAIPNYKLDTQVKDQDLKKNLILVGGPKANIIVDRVNKKLPIYFDYHREWNIVSPFSKQIYTEDNVGLIAKIKNPFNNEKEILIFAGKRFKGTRAAILALTKYLREVERGNTYEPTAIVKVIKSIDRDADGIIDDVEFLE